MVILSESTFLAGVSVARVSTSRLQVIEHLAFRITMCDKCMRVALASDYRRNFTCPQNATDEYAPLLDHMHEFYSF